MAMVAQTSQKEISDCQQAVDSLYYLPLSTIPLETAGLRKALLTKSARIETVVELFRDSSSGSGQVLTRDLGGFFHDSDGALARDIRTLDRVGELSSFDVFSLRIELREIGIDVTSAEALQLSPRKKEELTEYMKVFTQPLIQRIYGDDAGGVTDTSDIIGKIAQPNREEALRNLQKMASELEIAITEVPAFLERYGDIFLSLSYFRDCLDEIMVDVDGFIEWTEEIKSSTEILRINGNSETIERVLADLRATQTSIVGRFEFFNHRSRDFWSNINAESFREFRDLVTAHHVSIGAVLCGLAVKMRLWKERFVNRSGAPIKRMEFIRSEIVPGLSQIRKIEEQAGRPH